MAVLEKGNRIMIWFCLIVLPLSLYGQSLKYHQPIDFLKLKLPTPDTIIIDEVNSQMRWSQKSTYNPHALPIFCKMEHLIQKQSQIPVRIRLGDVQYVDKLESKH